MGAIVFSPQGRFMLGTTKFSPRTRSKLTIMSFHLIKGRLIWME